MIDDVGEYLAGDEGEAKPEMPSPVTRGARYISATTRWVLAGCPMRSDAEIDAILNQHCSQCPFFGEQTCTHAKCGCLVKDVSQETESLLGRVLSKWLANKLRRRTETCPDGRWL